MRGHGLAALAAAANLTPLPSLLLIGEDAAGRYYSMVAKATFTIESDGRLTLADASPMAPWPTSVPPRTNTPVYGNQAVRWLATAP